MHQRCGWEITTHDDFATRLWIKTKQVKSLRMNHQTDGSEVRPHGLHLRHRASPSPHGLSGV
jgi:hypothetical protein